MCYEQDQKFTLRFSCCASLAPSCPLGDHLSVTFGLSVHTKAGEESSLTKWTFMWRSDVYNLSALASAHYQKRRNIKNEMDIYYKWRGKKWVEWTAKMRAETERMRKMKLTGEETTERLCIDNWKDEMGKEKWKDGKRQLKGWMKWAKRILWLILTWWDILCKLLRLRRGVI
jgi:hypothetical protein